MCVGCFASIVVCLVLSISALIMSTECLRDRAAYMCRSKTVENTATTKVMPAAEMGSAAKSAWQLEQEQ